MSTKHALHLLRAGWCPLPLPTGQKSPPPTGRTGSEGSDLDLAEIRETDWSGNIGTRAPVGVVGIDIDHYGDKTGADTLNELRLERGLDRLPLTWRSSARPAPSGIYWFQIEPGKKLKGAPVDGVEIVQRHHRYAVLSPSVHPNGDHYRWHTADGVVSELPPRTKALPWLPAEWVEALADDSPALVKRTTLSVTVNPFRSTPEVSPLVDRALDLYLLRTGARHDAMHAAVTLLARLDSEGEHGTATALDFLRDRFVSDVTGDGSRSFQTAQSEFDRSVRDATKFVQTHQGRVAS